MDLPPCAVLFFSPPRLQVYLVRSYGFCFSCGFFTLPLPFRLGSPPPWDAVPADYLLAHLPAARTTIYGSAAPSSAIVPRLLLAVRSFAYLPFELPAFCHAVCLPTFSFLRVCDRLRSAATCAVFLLPPFVAACRLPRAVALLPAVCVYWVHLPSYCRLRLPPGYTCTARGTFSAALRSFCLRSTRLPFCRVSPFFPVWFLACRFHWFLHVYRMVAAAALVYTASALTRLLVPLRLAFSGSRPL